MAFGLMEDIPYREQHLMLEKGNCIYMYTDGVTEALNPKQEFFGDDYLEDVLNEHMPCAGDVEVFVKKMYEAVDAFADGEMQADDITMVYLSRR